MLPRVIKWLLYGLEEWLLKWLFLLYRLVTGIFNVVQAGKGEFDVDPWAAVTKGAVKNECVS